MKVRKPVLYRDDDETVELPTRWEICPQCRGEGKSSLYLGAFTCDEMDEMGPDFEDDYFSGRYDRTCETCEGLGRVKVVDTDRMKPELLKEWEEQCDADDFIDAETAAERRMGA